MQRGGRTSSLIPANPFDPRARSDPYPVYQFMRTVEPVHASRLGFWVLTRYADCRAVLEDGRWSHDADAILEPGRGALDPVDPTVRLLRASLAFSDPPAHTAQRRTLELVVRKHMKSIPASAQRVAKGLVKLMREKESADLIHDFAAPLPLVVLCDLIGIPPADRATVQRWGRELAGGLDPAIRAMGVLNAGAAAAAMVEYMLDRIEAARAGSGSGLIAELGAVPGTIRTWELIADLTAVFVIGVEAASGLIGNGALALLRHPEQLEELRRRPALIESGIEELIRFDGPVHLTARVATEDLDIGGTPIPAGGQAVIVLAAANRDPAHFTDPDRLDLSRQENDHLGFGAGTHGCFAAPLARVLASTAIMALATELPGLALSGDPEWLNSVTLRGLSHLPVAYDR